MDIHKLKETDHARYLKEYYEWCNHYIYDDWWDWVQEGFTEDCKPLGIRVDDIRFNNIYGWNATFEGRVNVAEWMKSQKLDEKWYPLYLAYEWDGSYVKVSVTYRDRLHLDWCDSLPRVPPIGVFSEMPEQDWEDMLQEMLMQLDPDTALRDYLTDLCSDLASQLEEAYEDETSEERFIDHCEANEVTFEEDEDEIQA
jgi:hypothetical protein